MELAVGQRAAQKKWPGDRMLVSLPYVTGVCTASPTEHAARTETEMRGFHICCLLLPNSLPVGQVLLEELRYCKVFATVEPGDSQEHEEVQKQ